MMMLGLAAHLSLLAGAGTCWRDLPGMNDVSSRVHGSSNTKCCQFLGVMAIDTLDACKAAAVAAGGGFAGVTYHTAAFARSDPPEAAYAKHCYGVHAGSWEAPSAQKDVDTSWNTSCRHLRRRRHRCRPASRRRSSTSAIPRSASGRRAGGRTRRASRRPPPPRTRRGRRRS